MKAIVIRVDGTIENIEMEPDLKSLQGAVGGYIQILQMTPKVHAYIDEEGKCKGKAVNLMATMLCRKLEIGLMPGDTINGDMILFGTNTDEDTCCIDIPENFIAENELLEYVSMAVRKAFPD